MSKLLQKLDLAPPDKGEPRLAGLVSVSGDRLPPHSIAERVACHEATLLEGSGKNKNIPIDYIFFRRFSDGRSPQIAAYVLDNSKGKYKEFEIAELHRRVWLNGKAPLLYVEWPTRVDVLKCATKAEFWDGESSNYTPGKKLEIVGELSRQLQEMHIKRFSAYRLSDGTFWENQKNADWACADKAAHQSLIQAIKETDEKLGGSNDPSMRRLLLLFILIKYLEDRNVFPSDNWFNDFHKGAKNVLDVLSSGKVNAVRGMLTRLESKFNGDIFNTNFNLTRSHLDKLVAFLEGKTLHRQMHFWKLFDFNYIPVEVLSHVYQHFAQKGNGAIFTPPLVVDLMLDYAMPYDEITGQETIFDPTCGSGIFLVGAFRRLVYHWKDNNNWKRPQPDWLISTMKKSIFGAELESDAAHVATFNLALAICDALQPGIIWDQLRFEKLIDTNIFQRDVFTNLNKIRDASKGGFTIILGNPPFKSALTPDAKKTRHEDDKIPIPDNQLSYRVIEESMRLLSKEGRMCLIQPHGFLYNKNPREFLKDWLSKNTVETILDFVSVQKLFENAEAKAVAIFAKPVPPEETHIITHLTFRRTKSLRERIAFELDHYDWHSVAQPLAENFSLVWKANLLGGGRLTLLAEEISNLPTLKQFFKEQGWKYGEGFNAGNQTHAVDFITKDSDYLPPEALSENGIDWNCVHKVPYSKFEAPRKKERYTPPMVLIREIDTLPVAFVKDRYLTFSKQIMSINDPTSSTMEHLQKFAIEFKKFRASPIARAICLLLSSRALVGMQSSILQNDIINLPWSKDGKGVKFVWWEEILLNDIVEHTAELLSKGEKAHVLLQRITPEIMEQYSRLFVKMLGTIYRNLRAGDWQESNGLVCQAFYFEHKDGVEWPKDWGEKIHSIIHMNNGVFQTQRIFHYFEKDKLFIVKPNLLRHWIQSTAIWDADEVLGQMYEMGF